MKDTYTIMKCRICGKLMKRYSYAVYPGDSSCCSECNKEAEKETSGYNHKIKEMR
jgi:hypothetical protein